MKKLKLLSLVLAMLMVVSFALTACTPSNKTSEKESTPSSESVVPGGSDPESESIPEPVENPKVVAVAGDPNYVRVDDEKSYTHSTYTAISPSNWNELTYQDNNDTQIMSYLTSPLFEFNYAFDANGEIIPGGFDIEFSFATAIEDVSANLGYPVGSAMAWAISIRNDGKWDDGTPIVADDFVYTMQEQLNPDFKHYRADSFYNGATVIKNARNYVFQGDTVALVDNNDVYYINSVEDLTKDANGVYNYNGNEIAFAVAAPSSWCGGDSLADYAGYLDADAIAALEELCDEDGYVPVTDETIALMGTAINTTDWNEPAENFIAYIHIFDYEYPELSFKEVGISAPDATTIVIELEQPLQLLDYVDGEYVLSYKCAYNFASLPLVKRDLWEDHRIEPAEGATLWTTDYHTSVASTASWGPYKLVEFQAGKSYKLEKNPYWYGWNMDKYDGQYQTTAVVCETIDSYETAWMKFVKGEIDGIGIDVSKASEYKNSAQAYYTPSDYVGSIQLQSSEEALANRETEGVNKKILTYVDFRKALSLGIDRDAYAKATTTAYLAGFGIFNSMHYYDVAHGGAYRETNAAKLVLCKTYGVDPEEFGYTGEDPEADALALDDAVDSITGYDLEQARALVIKAYNEALANGDIKETDDVVLTYGSSVDNEVTRRYHSNLSDMWTKLMVGTPLEGRFHLEFDASFGTKWADDFKAGAYDVCQGGWTGAAWDPGYFLLAYLSPAYMYSQAWATDTETLEFTMHGVNADGEATNDANDTFTAELALLEWYSLLNTEWQSGVLDEDFRLELIAALEGVILSVYYTVPVMYEFSASLISFKHDYITYEYNTFMGYGGIQYMTYNYDDAGWAAYVSSQGGELNYR